jgi:hypothetical protein
VKLADQLARFHAIVTGAAPLATSAGLVAGERAEVRMQVYVHAYTARIAGVLAQDYPKLATLCSLADLVAPYLRAHPPHAFSLREVGVHVARYLAARGEPAHLVDLATLERARTEVFDGGADTAPLRRSDLEAIGPEAFPTLQLRLVPAAQLVELTTNADGIWDAIETGGKPPASRAVTRTVLVWRRDVTVVHRTLDDDEARVVRTLVAGTTFAAACDELTELEDPAARALELLLRWLDAEILAA